ncbi:hypothetical protein V8F33_004353 [Rhypophila sp. PSN 637]
MSALRSGRGYTQSGGGDLAILSAETYVDPGLSFFPSPPASSTNSNNKKTSSSSTDNGSQMEGTSRKRLKRASPEDGDGEGDEEAKKRSRGRPRLDIKDETAADRRRTQIRLAQRAYRNRKENAIQTLERRVQELRDTNEEMSNAFMRLHDFAVNNGLVDQAPEFGRQLRATTEKFLTLARLSSEENTRFDDGESSSPKQISDGEPSPPKRNNKPSPKHQPPAVITPPPDASSLSSILANKGNQVYGGFIVTHEPVSDIDANIDDLFTPPATTTDFSMSTTTATSMPGSTLGDYEIITQPTLDNASFPLDFSFDLSNLTNPMQTQTSLSNTGSGGAGGYFNTYSGSLFPTLSIPTSYANQEATFGRRLQRTGIERALVLITMPNPPMKRFNRVFGFCLMLESKEAIYKRLMRAIQKTATESLNNWNFPFYNLGGAGTHHTQQSGSDTQQRMGNQGTVDVMKPLNTNGGFNIGPFEANISRVGQNFLDKDMRVHPGFQTAEGNTFGGEYFDCDEVEGYLHERGVVIPPAADFINAEVETGSFENGADGEDEPGLVINKARSPLGGITFGGSGGGRESESRNGTGNRKMVTVDVNLLVYGMFFVSSVSVADSLYKAGFHDKS